MAMDHRTSIYFIIQMEQELEPELSHERLLSVGRK
jgi:hypothetical protein